MISVSWRVTGLAGVREVFRDDANRKVMAASKALYRESERILAEAKPLTPFRTGTLRGSGATELEVTSTGVTSTIYFGGPAAPYALIVHESTHRTFKVGQAKFLEIPFNAAKDRVRQKLQEALDKA